MRNPGSPRDRTARSCGGSFTILSIALGVLVGVAMAHVRAQLGEPAYVSAWTDGRSMTAEQAIAAAFAESGTDGWNGQPAAVERKGSSPAADLTPREIEVLRLVAAGLTDAGIADQLVISQRTVNTHLVSIFDKLGVHTRVAATRFAVEHQLA
jgi:DNA-binding NarL/FixJ family response regulator